MKTFPLMAVLLLSCVSMAQQTGKGNSTSSGAVQQSTGNSPQSVQGCLQHSGSMFILNARGTQYRLIGGDETQLKGLTGHTVSVSGEKSGNEITMQSAQDISSTCESNTSTTNSTGTPRTQTGPTEDKNVPSTEKPQKPPMNEEPPINTPPPHAQTEDRSRMLQGSSELPLIGAVGFGMLAAGLWRRSR